MNFFAGFAIGSLVYLVARRRADRSLILSLAERVAIQSELLSKRATKENRQ